MTLWGWIAVVFAGGAIVVVAAWLVAVVISTRRLVLMPGAKDERTIFGKMFDDVCGFLGSRRDPH